MTALEPALILFAKTPRPGAVKSRLQPPLTVVQAAQVAELLIEQSVCLAQHWPGPVQLAVWPQLDHPLFHELARDYGLSAQLQCPGDLGQKMQHALGASIAQGRAAAILGCDVPHCPVQILHTAASSLAAQRAVLGPSTDGGYYLIGTSRDHPSLFQDIAWGTDAVLRDTLQRAKALGLSFDLLPPLTDIDSWPDLNAVKTSVPGLQRLLKDF